MMHPILFYEQVEFELIGSFLHNETIDSFW